MSIKNTHLDPTTVRSRAKKHLWLTNAAMAAMLGFAMPNAARAAASEAPASEADMQVRYRTVSVDGVEIFYREAGDPARPIILLLHGFPSSSHEFRNLIPRLSARFHLVAPDYPGFGFSGAPSAAAFTPTFANLTSKMERFVGAIGLTKFSIYIQDFGGPVGFRLAMAHPEMVEGLIIQNANAYEAGIAPNILSDMRTRAAGHLDAKATAALEQTLSPAGTKFQYVTGVRDTSNVDPTSYSFDSWIQAMPEQHRIQKALIVDYYDNVRQYSAWQKYLRERQPETLVLWGKGDPIFLPAGAAAYKADLPSAEIHLLDTGHFALEEDAAEIARRIVRKFAR